MNKKYEYYQEDRINYCRYGDNGEVLHIKCGDNNDYLISNVYNPKDVWRKTQIDEKTFYEMLRKTMSVMKMDNFECEENNLRKNGLLHEIAKMRDDDLERLSIFIEDNFNSHFINEVVFGYICFGLNSYESKDIKQVIIIIEDLKMRINTEGYFCKWYKNHKHMNTVRDIVTTAYKTTLSDFVEQSDDEIVSQIFEYLNN